MGKPVRNDPKRSIRAPRGTELSCKSWLTEAPMRMLMNNLDPEVAEKPEDLVVYGGIGRAARNWDCYDRIIETLKRLENNQSLLIQSGTGGSFRNSCRRTKGADCQFQPRPPLGDLGTFS